MSNLFQRLPVFLLLAASLHSPCQSAPPEGTVRDDLPVHILVMILGPDQKQDEYLKVLSRVTAFLKDQREKILSLEDSEKLYELTIDY